MEYLLGGGMLALAITSVVLAIRAGGLKADARDADAARARSEQDLREVAAAMTEQRDRHTKQLEALHDDINELETELAATASPDAVRARLAKLLSATTDDPGGAPPH